jgi:pyruvate dehydrogenase E2 component (dihydrolipoamide acetyltransferase)
VASSAALLPRGRSFVPHGNPPYNRLQNGAAARRSPPAQARSRNGSMAVKVRMPRVDANVDEGTVGKWLVEPGEAVTAGDPLCEIITDKASFELEADCGGIFGRAVVPEKSVVPVGYIIALLGDGEDDLLPDVDDENAAVMRAYQESLLSGSRPPEVGESGPEEGVPADGVRATPAARRLARQEGVPIEGLGRRLQRVVQKADVEREIHRLRGGKA